MYAIISPQDIQLPPGTVVRMLGTWQDYCELRDRRGDSSIPRIKYRDGEILLMSPLLRNARVASIMGDIVGVLLDSETRNYEAFTPITIDIPQEGGIEPDYCFYIDNWQAAVGKDRINWQIDPPDLVIEIDVTSYTAAEDFLPYKVPEVWLFKKSGLSIYGLSGDTYQQRSFSRYFPEVDLPVIISQVLNVASEQGTGVAIRGLRERLSKES